MFNCLDSNLEKKMNKALEYVADNFKKTGHNSKPVLLHSFKVGMTLYNYGYSENVIISGILHDLIEDTDITKEDIKQEYNDDVADIVAAVSFNKDISDHYEQAKELFERSLMYGYDALLVKCADLLDNINYVKLASNDLQVVLLKKYRLFLDLSKEYLKNEKMYQDLEKRVLEY